MRSFNPAMFTIFDNNHHHHERHQQRSRPTRAFITDQDIVTKCRPYTASSATIAWGKGPAIDQQRRQYLAFTRQRQQQQQQQAPLSAKAKAFCWCKLCFDSRQNSINHESLFATSLLLVADREKARPIILAIDDNGNDTYVDSGGCSSNASAGQQHHRHCEACLRHEARKNVYSPAKSSEGCSAELWKEGHEMPADCTADVAGLSGNYGPGRGAAYAQMTEAKFDSDQSLSRRRSRGIASDEMNNQIPGGHLQSRTEVVGGKEHELRENARQCNGTKKIFNKRFPRFRRNHLKRGTRPKLSPLKLVGLLSKHVIEKIIPTEMIGQEMEMRLTWPGTGTAPNSIPRNSEMVFRIAGGGVSAAGEREPGLIGKRDRVEGGCRRRVSELKVMDCALQLFNSRNCNDFLYFTIQRDLSAGVAAGSGNRYNMSWHEFPRGATETHNSSNIEQPPPSNPLHRQPGLLKGRVSPKRGGEKVAGDCDVGIGFQPRRRRHQRHEEYFETPEKKLQTLCHTCRANLGSELVPEFLRSCLGCDKILGFYRRRQDQRSLVDEQDVGFRAELKAREKQALIDLRVVLIQFNVHMQTQMLFFSHLMSEQANRFENLFNIDVLQSGSIKFHFHVFGNNRYVRFLCRGSDDGGGVCESNRSCGDKSAEVVYEMNFCMASTGKSSELVDFYIRRCGAVHGFSPGATIPEYLVSGNRYTPFL